MANRTAIVERCTAQRGNGSFCDYYAAPDMPFPICEKHALQVFHRMYEANTTKVRSIREIVEEGSRQRYDPVKIDAQKVRRAGAYADQSVVYYARIHDHVKIGFSTNMSQRLIALRVDPAAVLATEPGGRELESQRHKMFAEERRGKREDFNPSRRLLEHIKAVRNRHGEPVITGYIHVP